MLDNRLLRGREVGSLLVHSSHSFFLLFPLRYPTFFVFSIFFFCFQCFSLLFFPLVLGVPYCARLRHFYIACHDKIYHFTLQLIFACCGCPSWTAHWSVGCPATTATLRWPCHASFPEKSSFVFFFLASYGTPIQIRARVLSY